jgi:hypothetical protein
LFDSIPPIAENGEARLPVALESVDEEWLVRFQRVLSSMQYPYECIIPVD